MRVNDLGSPKKLILVCLAIFIALAYFGGNKPAQPIILRGTVTGLQEQDGILRALAVESDDTRFVVRIPSQYLAQHPSPALVEGQSAEIKVTGIKAVKQGITCDFVELVSAGPVPEMQTQDGSTPNRDKSLTVDDLKGPIGLKGM